MSVVKRNSSLTANKTCTDYGSVSSLLTVYSSSCWRFVPSSCNSSEVLREVETNDTTFGEDFELKTTGAATDAARRRDGIRADITGEK